MNHEKIEKLIAKTLLNEISEEEQHLLDEWLSQSDKNRIFLKKLQSEEYLREAIGNSKQELLANEWEKLYQKTLKAKRQKWYFSMYRIAAILLLPLMLGGLVWHLSIPKIVDHPVLEENIELAGGNYKALVTLSNGKKIIFSSDTLISTGDDLGVLQNHKDTLSLVKSNEAMENSNSRRVIQILRGAEYIVRLEDGSIVYLNAESELQVAGDFGINKREVWIKGEAYFKVQHDKERVFIVKTEKADISVLGTEFGIRAYGEEKEIQTTLVTGSVKINSGNVSKTIVPGEQACVGEMGNIEVRNVEVQEYIGWKDGRIVFTNVRLEDILYQLQRLYDFEVIYTKPEQKEWRFTIDINKYGKVVEIFELIQDIRKIDFEVTGRMVIIK